MIRILAFSVGLALLVTGCPFDITKPTLTLDELRLAAQTVEGHWKETDPIFDDGGSWHGSAGVIDADSDFLTLVTNRHVLGVHDLARADDDNPSLNSPEIAAYSLSVTFASGERRQVEACGDRIGTKDLALLRVDADGLVEGRDYVLLPIGKTAKTRVGDKVVAVGSPANPEWDGTHTFGRISAIRDDSTEGTLFQTDAAINLGNSGGPLFRKVGEDQYVWIGVNTLTVIDADNISFALDAQSVRDSSYDWFPASAKGAHEYISRTYIREKKLSNTAGDGS